MSSSAANASASDKEGEGIFAVQLEVMGRLLDAEKRKMALMQSELLQQTKSTSTNGTNTSTSNGTTGTQGERRISSTSASTTSSSGPSSTHHQQQRTEALQPSRTIQGEAVVRQRQSIARLQEQHDRLEVEYRTAAAGLLRKRSASNLHKGRSQPAIGLKQTTKHRPSIFDSLPGVGDDEQRVQELESIGEEKEEETTVSKLRRRSSLAASFVDVAGRSTRLSFVLAAETSSIVYKNGRLVSGTLDALIEHLVPTDKHYPDRTFTFAFLLCSRLYLQPQELMAKVAKQFRAIVGTVPGSSARSRSRASSTSDEADADLSPTSPDQPNTTPLALRPGVMATAKNMVQFLSEWTEAFAYDFRDERMMKHLKEITQTCASLSPAFRQSVGQVTSVVIKRLATLDKYEGMLNMAELAIAEKTSQKTFQVDIMEVCPSSSVLAQQLTHIELERLTHIGAEEFIQAFVAGESPAGGDGHNSDMKQTHNLEAYVEWFNRLSYLVAMEVCCTSKSKERKKQQAKVIEYFIDVANECCHLNNFNSLIAIVAGLNMSPVSRLKKTWSKASLAGNDLLETYSDPSSNFNNYRQALLEVMSCGQVQDENFYVIPFFSLLVKDIYFLNQAMKKQTAEKLVNFEKSWQLAKLVTQFMSWKQVAFDFDRSRPVLNYLMTTPLASEDELFVASFGLEPPESPYEKERCKALQAKGASSGPFARAGSKRRKVTPT